MISLFFTIILAVVIGRCAVWLLGKFAPGHPSIIDNIIWGLVVLFVILLVLSAVGVTVHDVPVPRLR